MVIRFVAGNDLKFSEVAAILSEVEQADVDLPDPRDRPAKDH